MPTISPALDLRSKPATASRPSSFSTKSPAISRTLRRFGALCTRAAEGRTTASPIIIAAISRVDSCADLAAADLGAAPQHADVVAERIDLAELVA